MPAAAVSALCGRGPPVPAAALALALSAAAAAAAAAAAPCRRCRTAAKIPAFRAAPRRPFHAAAPGSRAAAADPYELLGLKPGASAADIKRAYYARAKMYHPDTNGGNNDAHRAFVRIQEAYDILSDEIKRAAFVRSKPEAKSERGGFEKESAGGPGDRGSRSNFDGFADEDEMCDDGGGEDEDGFKYWHGGRRRRRRRRKNGTDVLVKVEVAFADALQGKTITVDVPRVSTCRTCSGEGTGRGSTRRDCRRCKGRGAVRKRRGAAMMNTECSKCRGSGGHVSPEARCGACHGQGGTKTTGTADVKIPSDLAGKSKKTVIRIPRKGNPALGRKGKAGDLFVEISVRPSEEFRRDGLDIHVLAEVPLTTAVLGGRVRVPTAGGHVDMNVRPGSQTGQVTVIRDRGIKAHRKASCGHRRGQLYVTINVPLPTKLTPRQRELFEFLAAEERESGVGGGGDATRE